MYILCSTILDFRGFHTHNLNVEAVRGGIPRHIGEFPETLSRQILAGRFLVSTAKIYTYTDHLEYSIHYFEQTL